MTDQILETLWSDAQFEQWQIQHGPDLLSRGLHAEMLRTLGSFRPGAGPMVYASDFTGNRWQHATAHHELTHQELAHYSSYGLFYQTLSFLAREGKFGEELTLCLQSQWGVHEATATYAQLSIVAVHNPDDLDAAIMQLPSGRLGAPPYREWFERVARYLPLTPGPTAQLATREAAIVGLAFYALDSDVLKAFPTPGSLTPVALRSYLSVHAPDTRFAEALKRMASNPEATAEYLDRCEAYARIAGNVTPDTVDSLERAIEVIAATDPAVPYVGLDERLRQSEEFARQWLPTSRFVIRHSLPEDRSSPAVGYPPEWYERAAEPRRLTLPKMREKFRSAQQNGIGLAGYVTMAKSGELHLEILSYPKSEGGSPASRDAVLETIDHWQENLLGGVCSTSEVLTVLDEFPGQLSAVVFHYSSWEWWDRDTHGHKLLQGAVQICYAYEFSEKHWEDVMRFRELGRSCGFVGWEVTNHLAALCFADVVRPGIYGIIMLPGEAALLAADRLLRRDGIPQLPGGSASLPHWRLLQLLAR